MHNSNRAGSASDKKAKEKKKKKKGLPRESGKICALVSSEHVF